MRSVVPWQDHAGLEGWCFGAGVIEDRNVAEVLYRSASFLPLTGAISVSLSNEQLKLKGN